MKIYENNISLPIREKFRFLNDMYDKEDFYNIKVFFNILSYITHSNNNNNIFNNMNNRM